MRFIERLAVGQFYLLLAVLLLAIFAGPTWYLVYEARAVRPWTWLPALIYVGIVMWMVVLRRRRFIIYGAD